MATNNPRATLTEVVQVENPGPRWRRIVIDTKDAEPVLTPFFERTIDDGLLGAYHVAFYFPVRKDEAVNWPRLSGKFAEMSEVDPALYNDPDVELVSRRKFTVRPVDGGWRHLELNFAVHETDGLALNWAKQAEVGMPLLVDLGTRVVDADEFPLVNNYVLLGDETSVPSIATMLERLPAGSTAHVCIEVTDGDDEWPFETDAKATIQWLHRGDQEAGTTEFLLDFAKSFDWPDPDDLYVWVASEGRQVGALRKYIRGTVGLVRGQYELNGYWRRGVRTERILAHESKTMNERLAAGLTPFERDQDETDQVRHKHPHEILDLD